ncbi:hypothetical protein K469DRAFT_701002 [Zopfia rhizophila CBS 207.26]|uniref:Uncharacterized protein n=1 Tax=Zopfia rhizophila CBS 207.26 TaxID=1314779 RepID=A0A6A6EDC8_9PEZI|nr:hypothetical protein K469DRAFT_701002 [Zopfia rhizophila CBS 207.26]
MWWNEAFTELTRNERAFIENRAFCGVYGSVYVCIFSGNPSDMEEGRSLSSQKAALEAVLMEASRFVEVGFGKLVDRPDL